MSSSNFVIQQTHAMKMTEKDTRTPASEELIPLVFKRVKGHKEDVQTLYELLRDRITNISHTTMPSFEDHQKFVRGHPYRFWYIVKQNSVPLGSVYFQFDNSIGINMSRQSSTVIEGTLKKALRTHHPLQGKESVRSKFFFVNTCRQNRQLEAALRSLGWDILQISYVCSTHSEKEVNNV